MYFVEGPYDGPGEYYGGGVTGYTEEGDAWVVFMKDSTTADEMATYFIPLTGLFTP